jgi:hypothetical protein
MQLEVARRRIDTASFAWKRACSLEPAATPSAPMCSWNAA